MIKGENHFLLRTVIAAALAIWGLLLLVNTLPLGKDNLVGNVFGFVFLCVWDLLAVLGILSSLNDYTSRIELNDEGVVFHSCFKKNFVRWSDIKDWGLSYGGKDRQMGNMYHLYFSKEEQQEKDECRKKLKGPIVKIYIVEKDYEMVVDTAIPYGCERTAVVPFVGKNTYHFM